MKLTSTCVIQLIDLFPYSEDKLLLVSGYSCDEVKGFIREHFKVNGGCISSIRNNAKSKRDWLDLVDRCDDWFTQLDKGGESYCNGLYAGNDGCEQQLIILKFGFDPGNSDDMITLAHEVLHLCQGFLKIYLHRDNEHEGEAYFHSYVMRQIVSCFKKG